MYLFNFKDITTELNRRLVEALEREELYEKTSQSGSLDAIQYYVSLFKLVLCLTIHNLIFSFYHITNYNIKVGLFYFLTISILLS